MLSIKLKFDRPCENLAVYKPTDSESPIRLLYLTSDGFEKLNAPKVIVVQVSSELSLNEAIEIAKRECKNEYAQAYLNAIDLAVDEFGSEGLRVQLLYCLSNMSSWKGENARLVKAVFKKWSKK